MTHDVLESVVNFEDDTHCKCKAIVSRDDIAHIFDTYSMMIYKSTTRRSLAKLRLSWDPIKL